MRIISERGNTRVSRGNMGNGSKRLRGWSVFERSWDSSEWTGLDIDPGRLAGSAWWKGWNVEALDR
jgi:hypothetical protein